MNKAKGQQGSEVLLYKPTQKAELSQFLDSNANIAFEFNEKDENGNPKFEIKNGKVSDLVKNPICITQETQLSALAIGIVDFICIQPDRHWKNFFIDKNGKMTGIDNDAVGIVDYGEEVTKEIMKVKVPFVTSQIKEKIINLYDNKDMLLNFLRGKMNIGMQGNKVISEMEKCLDMLYNYIKSNNCPICDFKYKDDFINHFLLAHNNFSQYCTKVGRSNGFILSESNPIALIIHNSIGETFNRFAGCHY
jgi:hypothetical protein